MVAHHSSALEGVAADPALPTPLKLRLIAFDDGGYGPPRQVLRRTGLPEPAVAAILAHPSHDPDGKVRREATGDPRLPRLREALGGEDVAYAAVGNPALPEAEMARVLDEAGVPA
jgi:hypothetical protein